MRPDRSCGGTRARGSRGVSCLSPRARVDLAWFLPACCANPPWSLAVLTLWRNKRRTGIGRREFLRLGGFGLAGLTLADVLRAEEQAGPSARRKSIIYIVLGGGP